MEGFTGYAASVEKSACRLNTRKQYTLCSRDGRRGLGPTGVAIVIWDMKDTTFQMSIFYIVPIRGLIKGTDKFPIQKCAIFCKFKNIKELRGGVLL